MRELFAACETLFQMALLRFSGCHCTYNLNMYQLFSKYPFFSLVPGETV